MFHFDVPLPLGVAFDESTESSDNLIHDVEIIGHRLTQGMKGSTSKPIICRWTHKMD